MYKAIDCFQKFSNKVSLNHTRTVWVLKCDIRKFFASIDHTILAEIIQRYIPDARIKLLLAQIVDSFSTAQGKGLPLGNLTSQLFVNIYMNEFDQFVKHKLKAKYYIRYADDFVFLSEDEKWLESILPRIRDFLFNNLRLTLHPDKVFISTVASGVDFLGWIHFPDHRVLRTTTKQRMWRRIEEMAGREATVQSYFGLLSHGDTHKLMNLIKL
jgi:retron-type reverse transcriptase